MIIQRIFNSDLAINTYIIGDKDSRQCAVIDPPRDITDVVEFIESSKLDLRYILETHVHADFVSGSKELKEHFKGAPKICCSTCGGTKWVPGYSDHGIQNGEEIELGQVRLKARHTPGHTPEHLIWLCFDQHRSMDVPWFLLSGDLLFVGSVGRPDLLGDKEFQSLASSLYKSLFETIADLPDFVEIMPAHGAGSFCGKALSARPSSTLGFERLFNPSLKKLPLQKWVEELKEDMPAAPHAYGKIKDINVQGPKLMKEIFSRAKQLKADEIDAAIAEQRTIIDVRTPELFAAKHLHGSLNIPMKGPFTSWAEMALLPGTPYILILPSLEALEPLKKKLALAGLEEMEGYAVWDETEKSLKNKKETIALLPPDHVHKHAKERVIIDVRTPAEWHSGHISGAKHFELAKLQDSLGSIPKDTPLATVCGSGYRASIAASILKNAGFNDVGNIQGGMHAWKEAKLPTVTKG